MALDPNAGGYDPNTAPTTPEYMTPLQIKMMQDHVRAIMDPKNQPTLYKPWQGLAMIANGLANGYLVHQLGQAERNSLQQANQESIPQLPGVPSSSGVGAAAGGGPASASQPSQSSYADGGQIDRSRFAQELDANPQLKQHIMAVSAGENNDPKSNLAVIESMMNRAHMMGTSLAQESRLASNGGYYTGYSPSALNNPKTRAMLEQNVQTALGGSNVSNYATDNSSEGTNNFTSRRYANGMYAPTLPNALNGEYFSYPNGANARGHDRYSAWRNSVSGSQQPQKTASADTGTATDAQPSAPPSFAEHITNVLTGGGAGGQPAAASGPAAPLNPNVNAQVSALTGGNPAAPSAPVQTAQAATGNPAASGPSLLPQSGQYVDPRLLQQRIPVSRGEMVRTMANPWIDPDVKKLKLQQYYEQIQPRTMETAGGTIIVSPDGKVQGFNPKLEKGSEEAGGAKQDVYRTFVPGQGLVRVPDQSQGTAGGSAAGGMPSAGSTAVGVSGGNSLDQLGATAARIKANEAAAVESAKSGPAAQAEYAKSEAQAYQKKMQGIESAASAAQADQPNIKLAQKIVNDPRFYSGHGSDIIGKINSYAQTAGLSKGETSSLQQIFTKAASKENLNSIKELASGGGVGPIRVAEMNLINNAGATLENNPDANRVILEFQKRLGDRSIETKRLADAYADTHNGQIDRGFEKMRDAYYDKKPLFEDNEIDNLNGLLTGKPSAAKAASQYREGQTATDANGNKVIFTNGKWNRQ